MSITHLDCVQVSSPEPERAARAWETLLGREAHPAGTGFRIGLANTALEITKGAHAGLSGLVFAGSAMGTGFPERGVVSTLRANAPAPVASPSRGAPRAAAIALDHVVVRSVDLDACLAGYRHLGLRLALDRCFPERGVRLAFFRFGHVTLELSGVYPPQPETSPSAASDTLWGVAWRVPSIEAARERIEAAGFSISEYRKGHKEGTRVFTVLEAPCAVPTLVLEDPSRGDPFRGNDSP